ncbi:MAG: cyclic nucleotide-binding domain-containing protein [Planctomycetota bacterium]
MSEEGLLGRIYKDGEVIVKEGTQSRTMYVIQSGNVKVVKSEGETETALAMLGEGDIFGEMSLFDAKPRSATVKAVGEARVLAIDHENFLKRIKMDPSLAFRTIKQMSQRIRDLNSRLSFALGTVNQAHNTLSQLKEAEDIGIKGMDVKLGSILDSVAQIQQELLKLKVAISSHE